MSWMKYANEVCELTPRKVMGWEMRFIMDRYTTGVKPSDCASEMPLEAPVEPVEKRSFFIDTSVSKERKQSQKRK